MLRFQILLLVGFLARAAAAIEVPLETDVTLFKVRDGFLTAAVDKASGSNWLAADAASPLLAISSGGQVFVPEGMAWDATGSRLTLQYRKAGVEAVLHAVAKPTHVVFKVESITPLAKVELVIWGPYQTVMKGLIGETVGVVRDGHFALGLQALNAKTLGGPPADNKDEGGFEMEDHNSYPGLSLNLGPKLSFRGRTAEPTPRGSLLQAYCKDRSHDSFGPVWGHAHYFIPRYDDGGPIGSSIALFGCPAARALETIGQIEVAEGLPHPMLDGRWAKTAYAATASYVIIDFSEANIQQAIAITKAAGLKYLYHSSPFETWGHFVLRKSAFPHGWAGFKECVDQAEKVGLHVGFHTLSNFITPNDAYVTPKPDPRLARIGFAKLTEPIDATAKEIVVDDPEPFRKKTDLNTVVLGEELVQYAAVSEQAPWRLLQCRRGAYGTAASAHPAGAQVAKLMDHGYKVFLTDADLGTEVARRIADFCNQTGARQLSFDGLEGNWSTGYGQYGRTLFVEAWYKALLPQLQGQIINDASNPGHYNWHTYTRMNWGEPWYAGFRESQAEYRFMNQYYYTRNLMPRMLGWFALREGTSVEDAEWLCARAAGLDAGFALATSIHSTAQLTADESSAARPREEGNFAAILHAIRTWETARMAGAFPEEVKLQLQKPAREFHLVAADANHWDLQGVESLKAHVSASGSQVNFTNPYASQPLVIFARNSGRSPVTQLNLRLGSQQLRLDGELKPGQILLYAGGNSLVVFDRRWRETGRQSVGGTGLNANKGVQKLGCDWAGQGEISLELRTLSPPQRLTGAGPACQLLPSAAAN